MNNLEMLTVTKGNDGNEESSRSKYIQYTSMVSHASYIII